VHLLGGDCLGADSCAQSLSPGSISPSSRAMHADHPLGRDPPMGRLCPSGFPTVVRTATFLHLMHGSLMRWVSPCWNRGCGLKTTSLYLSLLSGVPRPEASIPLPPPPRLSLPEGIRREHLPGLQNSLKRLYHADPGDAQDRSTPEAGQLPRPWTLKKLPLLLCSTSSGFLTLGPIMLTLVNARGQNII